MKNDFSFPSAARDVRLFETWNGAPPFFLSHLIYTHVSTNNASQKHNKTKTSNRWQNMFVATAASRSLCVTQSLRSAEITYFSHPTRSNPKLLWCVCSSRHTSDGIPIYNNNNNICTVAQNPLLVFNDLCKHVIVIISLIYKYVHSTKLILHSCFMNIFFYFPITKTSDVI